jgi:hypothetical protein
VVLRRRGSRLHRRLRAAQPLAVVLVGFAAGTLAAFRPDLAIVGAQLVGAVLVYLWLAVVLGQV